MAEGVQKLDAVLSAAIGTAMVDIVFTVLVWLIVLLAVLFALFGHVFFNGGDNES